MRLPLRLVKRGKEKSSINPLQTKGISRSTSDRCRTSAGPLPNQQACRTRRAGYNKPGRAPRTAGKQKAWAASRLHRRLRIPTSGLTPLQCGSQVELAVFAGILSLHLIHHSARSGVCAQWSVVNRCLQQRSFPSWPELIRRVWHVDTLHCPVRQSPLRVIAIIDDPAWWKRSSGTWEPGTTRPSDRPRQPCRVLTPTNSATT
jgi:hypothetical protein